MRWLIDGSTVHVLAGLDDLGRGVTGCGAWARGTAFDGVLPPTTAYCGACAAWVPAATPAAPTLRLIRGEAS